MATEEVPALAPEEKRLRHEALLKECELCQQEASDVATRLGVWTALVFTGLLIGLGFVLRLGPGLATVVTTCIGTGAALFVGWVMWQHTDRTTFTRQLMWERQRQIERELGLYKSRNAQLVSESRHFGDAYQKGDEIQREFLRGTWGKPGRARLAGRWFDFRVFSCVVPLLWMAGLGVQVARWMRVM